MNLKNKENLIQRKRLRFIRNKKENVIKNDLNIKQNVSLNEKNIVYKSEIINIKNSKESKMFLIKNKNSFSFIGKGKIRLLFGEIKIFGFELKTNFELFFDFSEKYPIFISENIGEETSPENEYYPLFKDSLEKHKKDKFSLIIFEDLTNFRFLFDFEISNFSSISTNFFEKTLNKRNEEDFSSPMLIAGKKNSGKSTFCHFLVHFLLNFQKNKQNGIFFLDCDSGQPFFGSPFCISLIYLEKPFLTNYPNNIKNFNGIQILKEIFVKENNPSNFEFYLREIQNFFNFYLKRKPETLIINTNGYTTGLGNLIDPSILKISNAEICFFVKNQNYAKKEEDIEFENFFMKDVSNLHLSAILGKYDLFNYKQQKFVDIEKILIENNFKVQEKVNQSLKEMNKQIYFLKSVFSNFSLNEKVFRNLKNISFMHYLKKGIISKNIQKFKFEQIYLSFSEFEPNNDMDCFMALNGKPISILKEINIENKEKIKHFGFLKSFQENLIKNAEFICFGFIFNIDIISKEFLVVCDFENFKENKQKEQNFTFFRTKTLDKYIKPKEKDNNLLLTFKNNCNNVYYSSRNSLKIQIK